jgi:hypothetical protein
MLVRAFNNGHLIVLQSRINPDLEIDLRELFFQALEIPVPVPAQPGFPGRMNAQLPVS